MRPYVAHHASPTQRAAPKLRHQGAGFEEEDEEEEEEQCRCPSSRRDSGTLARALSPLVRLAAVRPVAPRGRVDAARPRGRLRCRCRGGRPLLREVQAPGSAVEIALHRTRPHKTRAAPGPLAVCRENSARKRARRGPARPANRLGHFRLEPVRAWLRDVRTIRCRALKRARAVRGSSQHYPLIILKSGDWTRNANRYTVVGRCPRRPRSPPTCGDARASLLFIIVRVQHTPEPSL